MSIKKKKKKKKQGHCGYRESSEMIFCGCTNPLKQRILPNRLVDLSLIESNKISFLKGWMREEILKACGR